MKGDWQFQYTVPPKPEGELVALSFEEMERALLKKLETEAETPDDALWQLARFYSQAGDVDSALGFLKELLERQDDPENKATCILSLGCLAEQTNDFQLAVRYYKEAFALEPMSTGTWYFINNNLGYSLCRLGFYEEGERYCRNAIQIDSGLPNGFKNLGIALEGQQQWSDAAECYVIATQVNASDPRAFIRLERLLEEHPALESDFSESLEHCREAVAFAGDDVESSAPQVHRGFAKQVILLKAWFKRVFGKFKKQG